MLTATTPRPEDRTRLLLQALEGGRARSGTELAAHCGFPGSGGQQWLETLVASSILVETGRTDRRRPRDRALALNDRIGVLTADIGTEGISLELRDLGARRKAGSTLSSAEARDPQWSGAIADRVDELYARAGQSVGDVRAVVVGLSPAIAQRTSAPLPPAPIDAPWIDMRSVVRGLGPRDQVTVESRTSLTAMGHSVPGSAGATVLHVEVGFDVEAGVVTDGTVIRGAQSAAGGLGHFVVPDRRDARCWCGNRGCLTAVAGGAALARAVGLPPGIDALERLLALERAGDVQACRALRAAGWEIGRALRSCATILDPAEIVVAGALGAGSPGLRWGLSETYGAEGGATRCPVVHAPPTENVFALGATRRAIHLAVRRCFDRPVAVAG